MKMNKNSVLRYLLGIFVMLGFVACMDDDDFSTSKSDLLSFSTDTVRLDTTFSNVPTPTKTMWVYNRTGKSIRCSNVRLEGGNQEGFRVNVDGTYLGQTSGYQTRDVEVRKGDSIRVFVELTSSMQQEDEPQLVQDNLVFTLESGVQQKINLRAMSWDAISYTNLEVNRGETLTLGDPVVIKNEDGTEREYHKPIVIYGGIKVDSMATLNIKEGATLYFHENAGIQVYGKLLAEGTAEKPVTLRGDRIDHMFDYLPYDRTPGQWQGIKLMEYSQDNVLKYTDLHSAYDGIVVDSSDVNVQKLLLENSIVHNCQGVGVEVKYAKVQIYNTQLSNTLGHCLYVCGGDVDVNNCTIAQFYPFDARRGSAIGFKAPVKNLSVKNSIVTGYADDEVVWTPPVEGETAEEETFNFSFDHCLLRTEKMTTDDSSSFTNVIYEDLKNEVVENEKDTLWFGEKQFVNFDTGNLIYDFRLKGKSAAIGVADAESALPYDRNGLLKRDEEKTIAGCYLYREEKNDAEK